MKGSSSIRCFKLEMRSKYPGFLDAEKAILVSEEWKPFPITELERGGVSNRVSCPIARRYGYLDYHAAMALKHVLLNSSKSGLEIRVVGYTAKVEYLFEPTGFEETENAYDWVARKTPKDREE